MASLLQGFEEVQLVKPVGKTVLTVTDSAIRFNKATAEVLGFPAYVKVLINDKTRQIAVTPTTAKAANAYPESKTVIFDVANATAGTMKRRGRKKAA